MKWYMDVERLQTTFVVVETPGDRQPTQEEIRTAALGVRSSDWENDPVECTYIRLADSEDEGYPCYVVKEKP